ncbi:hypothetical protein L227DRAFT_508225 [Lentinus tigrinus ALCF2SS1-6]|uniref:DUF6535 domain-containing protein n=2 Tax=Lentinus tigrinus TaxID=5365 RepID=A0A5C2S174_9APHY|nr:hypothetical protein L227DRAFT_508225 [Lentinus tigrinus ALCF2SS1-6]
MHDGHPKLDGASAAWTECARVVKDHSDEMVKRWKDEIDTLLVYAGLFSGVITAFNVQSYALLQASSSDASVAVLAHISDQLKSFSLNPPFINSTIIPSPTPASFRAPRSAIWINVLWFSSLICSLSAASIGIMVKQWLHEAELGLTGTSREAARIRQYRYDGMQKWQVGMIVATLPVLLQLAAMLFFAGLLVLLWTLHPVVATVASTLVGTLFLFTIGTIILPAFVPDCTYRSPQALVLFLLVQAMGRFLRPILTVVARLIDDRGVWLSALKEALLSIAFSDWGSFRGWAGRDRVETTVGQHTLTLNALDENILEIADAVLLDDRFLEECVRPCVKTLPSWSAVQCYQKIRARASRIFHLGPLWGRYGSLGYRYEAQVELTLDVIERCLNDAVQLYEFEDLKPIVKELLLRLQYPLSVGVSERCGHVIAGVVALGGDFPDLVMKTLHSRECLADGVS